MIQRAKPLPVFQATVRADQTGWPLKRIWRSTGFSPAEMLLGADMQQTLIYMATLPGRAIEYVRIHYLYNLLRVTGQGPDWLVYDWSLLDEGLDFLVRNRLKPIFELMGNPSEHFKSFRSDAELNAWRALVRDTARRYIGRYGREEVLSWYFETSNEPDLDGWWPYGTEAFCDYYDACSEGLRDVEPGLRLGGPSSARTLSPLFKAFIAHCDRGTNRFTGETGVRLDFISVHEKGARASREDLTPDLDRMCRREHEALSYVREHHPRLAGLPFMNNESDPQVGWSDFHTWHARPYYAALVCCMVGLHLQIMDAGVNYEILSNDNAFMGGWGQRSLLALFGGKELHLGQSAHRTVLPEQGVPRQGPPPFALVKKPVVNVMALLAALDGDRCVVDRPDDRDIGVIAARRSDRSLAVLVYHACDHLTRSDLCEVVLHLEGLPAGPHMLRHYRIDEAHGNPYRLWDRWDGPAFPTDEQFACLRENQEFVLLEAARRVEAGDGVELRFTLPLPGVSLILLAPENPSGPKPPRDLRAHHSKALNGGEDVLLTWQPAELAGSVIYEVLRAERPDGSFERVGSAVLLGAAFLVPAAARGSEASYWRVCSVDTFGRSSDASAILRVDARG